MRIVTIALMVAWSGHALAHGEAGTGGGHGPTPHAHGFWESIVSPAAAAARVNIDEAGGYRRIESDGLPDHATGRFPGRGNPHSISPQDYSFRVPLEPQRSGRTTRLGHHPFGVALNGVIFDPLTAEYWNRDRSSGWNIEALSGAMNLGLDSSNAHVQPNGAYHYHGLPMGILERFPYTTKPTLLGWAADGFPIYGPYGYSDANDSASRMIKLKSGHGVKSGTRPSGPGGRYDGTYVQDYEFQGGGDLDDCNGREGVTPEFPDGTYYYVLTDSYPFIPRCFKGTVDRSFLRSFGQGGGLGGGPGMGERPPPRPGIRGSTNPFHRR